MTGPARVLAAGGLVPAGARLGRGDAADAVIARAYRHAALPGRTVVRLAAEGVAAGDDLELAMLGFPPAEDRGAVAKARRRPLGFPGWVLVHDPDRARLALDVAAELADAAREARSRPKQAREQIEALGARLGRSVPHFLPPFYEEAGRVFLEHGAPVYAAAMFGKARDAEGVHALPVDEQHRADAFLEFALAGAVTAKALARYGRELAEHHAPEAAYARFRQLCVQRTLAGLPPWPGMAKELRRLAKAAHLDADAQDAAFVAEIIESPALARAPAELWRAYRGPLARLGARSPAVRGLLLNLFPAGPAYSAELDLAWLELLDAAGAVEALLADGAPPEARPRGGRAGWLDELLQHLSRGGGPIDGRVLQLLRRMAPMLIRDGAPIRGADRRGRIDLDVVELALELGVPVAPRADSPALVDPTGPPRDSPALIDLGEWAKHAGLPERGRDPVRVAAHPRLGPLLAEAVAAHAGNEAFEAAARGKQGLLAARRAWLERVIARAERGALPGIEDALAVIAGRVPPETFAELPELHARFAAIDLAAALARTLRIGILDELGWPALEAAVDEAAAAGHADVAIHGGPPAAVVVTRTRAIAIGPAGRLAEHDLVVPPGHEVCAVRFIGGEFLVLLAGDAYRACAYWSRAPRDVFETELSEEDIPRRVDRAAVLADGAWLEAAAPVRAGDRELSLGAARHDPDGGAACAVELPGGGAPRPVVVQEERRGATVTILDPAGEVRGSRFRDDDRRYLCGQPAALTPGFWRAMVPRDEAGSRRLRAISDGDARALMAAADAGVLGIAHPRLRVGIDGLTALAVQLERERDRLAAERAPVRARVRVEAAGPGVTAPPAGRPGDAAAAARAPAAGAIPDELVAAAERELRAPIEPREALEMIAAAAGSPRLDADGSWALDRRGVPIRAAAAAPLVGQDELADAPPVFDGAAMATVASYVPFLYAELPVGHPLRARAAAAYERALARLANPALWLDGGHTSAGGDADRAEAARVFALLVQALGGEELAGLHAPAAGRRIPGAAVVYGGSRLRLALHPASLDAKAAAAVEQLAGAMARGTTWRALAVLRSADLAAIVARIRTTPVPAGGHEQDPLASTPGLVERVRARRALSPDAAALYLQLLTLLRPTPGNLRRWNGWAAPRLEAATGELVARGLVIEAARDRAERTHFLPGAWEPGKPPHPPREAWKVPLYTAAGGRPPLGRFLALAPFHLLFERAWQRVEAGDEPRYEPSRSGEAASEDRARLTPEPSRSGEAASEDRARLNSEEGER